MSSSHLTGHRTPGPQSLVAGRYRLLSRIGGGGMGAVWLARDQLLDREVAVKQVVSTEGLSEESAENIRTRAMREGRIAAKFAHRNAIATHDVALERGEPWLVMEYLPSRSVAQILHTTKTLGIPQAAQIGAQVADAVADAHAGGILHRDIKPGNILISTTGRSAGQVKITDFGISRAKNEESATQSGVITGTPAYFAPEVARGAEPGEASDVYSLGATVYTIVEGQPPYGVDDDSIALLHKVARARINPMTKAGELHPVILRLLEPNPAKRPTMAEARDLLAQVAAGDRRTVAQVLTNPITTPDGGTPIWAQRSPRPTRATSTGTHLPVASPSLVTGPQQRPNLGAPAPRSQPYQPAAPGPAPAAANPTPPPARSSSSAPMSRTTLGILLGVGLLILLVIVIGVIAL